MKIQWVWEPYKDNFVPIYDKKWNPPQKLQEMFQKKELEPEQPCLHDSCPTCHGTGVSIHGGMCFHNLSCNCPKCSWR